MQLPYWFFPGVSRRRLHAHHDPGVSCAWLMAWFTARPAACQGISEQFPGTGATAEIPFVVSLWFDKPTTNEVSCSDLP